MNQEMFQNALTKVKNNIKNQKQIGTLSEKTLHAVVKNYINNNDETHEIKIGSYYADIFIDNQITEIQTKQFNKLRDKLSFFLKDYEVRVVYPTSFIKWINWINPNTFEVLDKRLSPKKGTIYNIFPELYRIKSYLDNPKLKLTIMLFNINEYRFLNGWSENKKKGSVCYERIPTEFIDSLEINSKEDYKKLIPDDLPNPFTSKDFSKFTKLTLKNSQIAVNVLSFLKIIKLIGKQGKLNLYNLNEEV